MDLEGDEATPDAASESSDGRVPIGDEQAATGPSTAPSESASSQEAILARVIDNGLDELTRPSSGLFLSGLSAGLDIGFGPLFMAGLYTLAGGTWGEPTVALSMSLLYSLGFVFIVIGRTELSPNTPLWRSCRSSTAGPPLPSSAGSGGSSTPATFWAGRCSPRGW